MMFNDPLDLSASTFAATLQTLNQNKYFTKYQLDFNDYIKVLDYRYPYEFNKEVLGGTNIETTKYVDSTIESIIDITKSIILNKRTNIFYIHNSIFTTSYNGVTKPIVPINFVHWNKELVEYKPITVNGISNIELEKLKDIKFNHDSKISNIMKYNLVLVINVNVPLNPMGRTGVEGKGSLESWGPNHINAVIPYFIDKVTKQIKVVLIKTYNTPLDRTMYIFKYEKDTNYTIKEQRSKICQMTEDMVNNVITINSEHINCIYKGYYDSNENTDNAWKELSLYTIYLEDTNVKIFTEYNEESDDIEIVSLSDPEIKDKVDPLNMEYINYVKVIHDKN